MIKTLEVLFLVGLALLAIAHTVSEIRGSNLDKKNQKMRSIQKARSVQELY